MRKIEREMVSAIRSLNPGEEWAKDNTRVDYDATANVVNVYLHGNLIAKVEKTMCNLAMVPLHVHITLAGWNTATTRSRLTAILRSFVPGCFGVSTKQGQARIRYADGRDVKITDNGWYLAS